MGSAIDQFEIEAPQKFEIAPPQKAEQGFLDKEIPIMGGPSWLPGGNATLSGVQSIGRGFRSVARGVGATFNPKIGEGETALTANPVARIGRGLLQTGKQALQIPDAIHDINQSPDPLGTYAKAGQETAGEGAAQALTALGTEGVARAVPKITNPIARRGYQSALKPPPSLGADEASKLVDTGLEHKIPVSESGIAKLGDIRDATEGQIANTIAKNPTRTVNKFKVASRLGDTAKKFATQVNPEADSAAISDSGNEFLRNQPGEIPGPDAQALKQGTYRALGSKAYGEVKGASMESQKALARGLKEELVKQYPELRGLNETDSRLINLQDALETSVARAGNREPLGLGGPIAYGVTKAATGSSGLGIAAGVLKSALRNPAVKSRLAIALRGVGKTTGRPGLGASVGGIAPLGGDQASQPGR